MSYDRRGRGPAGRNSSLAKQMRESRGGVRVIGCVRRLTDCGSKWSSRRVLLVELFLPLENSFMFAVDAHHFRGAARGHF